MSTPTSRQIEFFDAIKSGAHDRVRTILGEEPGLVSTFDAQCFGATPLVHAAGLGDRAMIDLLLQAGADPDQRNDWWAGGFRPLDDCSEETADYLLQRGATLTPHAAARLGRITELRQIIDRNPDAIHQRGGDGQFPLHFSRSPQIAELLLSRGAEIDGLDVDHESTAAQWCLPERPEVAAYLVTRGARLDPFMAAMIGDVADVQRFVESDPDGVHARITRDRFPTSTKAAGHIYLFTLGENCTLMHAAANGNRPEIVPRLAGAGADVNARGGYDDQTPLHATAWRDCPEAAAALLDAGADINIRSGKLHENEPIGWAIVSGAARTVQLLLSRGCALRDVHRADAVQGAAGMWRCFNRRRPLEAWREVAQLVSEVKNRPGSPP